MEFDPFIGQAWNDHASDAVGVAARLDGIGRKLVSSEAQATALAGLGKGSDVRTYPKNAPAPPAAAGPRGPRFWRTFSCFDQLFSRKANSLDV